MSGECMLEFVFFLPGFQPQPVVSVLEYGSAEVSKEPGFAFVGDILACYTRATKRGHWIASCSTPALPAAISTSALLGPAG